MAEFRKLFYAFGLAALLTGVSSTASAQTTICNSNAGVPPVIRSESFSDLVGDYVLDCTGGVPTAQGQAVPQVNFTVTLSTQITSRLLGSAGFTEALLLVDEPNQPIAGGATNPVTGTGNSTPLLACGDANAPDNTISGPGVCTITVATGVSVTPAQTYNGAAGHPNVFQGKVGVAQNSGDSNIIVFAGVPFDPPGTLNGGPAHRFFRFTNIRANAPLVASGFVLQNVVMYVNVNGSTSVAINNPSQVVASVQRGLQPVTVTPSTVSFVQCLSPTGNDARDGNGGSIKFTEGFESSFKVRNIGTTLANESIQSGAYRVNTSLSSYGLGTDNVQNVPGAAYNTESGFVATSTFTIPNPNAPTTIGAGASTQAASVPFPATSLTSINNAGRASQGTRLAVSFREVPAGLTLTVPLTVDLTRAGTSVITGKARLVTTTANGSDSTLYTTVLATSGVIGSNNLAVYEVVADDPFALEDLTVPVTVSYTSNLASNLPEPFKTAQAAGGFAPFLSAADSNWQVASATLPTPRFRNTITTYGNLFNLTKCACNLLFPYVSNASVGASAYDTGIAIANTSALPTGNFGFSQTSQAGTVQFWFYPALNTTTAPPTQCTNTTSPGTCPGTKVVNAGETLTYVLSTGSSTWGLVGAPGFTGYMVAQTQFQYCHAFAYIAPQGAGPLTNGMSVGYLGLILDKSNDLAKRTNQQGEALNQ